MDTELVFMPVHEAPRVFLGMPAVIASPAMQRLMQTVERIAPSSASVLVTGESGSGKEVIARAMHHYSLRATRPWVDLSCAALPEHLIESELFGYEKGAFSGADNLKAGLFELAHQGTLFLDEIGELDPRMQVKLLRVLDGVPYYRLGGTRKVTSDVRIVAATNRGLEQAVAQGTFRGDLYHRLSQIILEVPPLRERVEDIAPIARHFLAQHDPRLTLSDDAVKALEAHSWPGNIRELRNVVIKAAVLALDPEVRAANLSLPNAPQKAAATNLDGVEKQTIMDVLARTGGHQQKAAALLGISRRTLSRKLRAYGENVAEAVL
jgi:DNA-binding NtrC family response regulator